MENLVDKYRKICCLSLQDLIKLHKLYCITLHPLWQQVVNKYWKSLDKYWTPTVQVSTAKHISALLLKISSLFSNTQPILTFSQDLGSLIELMEYYNAEVFYSDKSVDKTYFSAMLVLHFFQYTTKTNIYPLLFTSLCAFFTLTNEKRPKKQIPLNHTAFQSTLKDDSDFLLWLFNNFTNSQEVEESLKTALISVFPDLHQDTILHARSHDNKKIILLCRETFAKLLKLKNSEFKTKKILPVMKSTERSINRVSFDKCRLPVEGRSIKLQSPQSLNKFKPALNTQPEIIQPTKEFHPELYETLVQQYKRIGKNNHSGCNSSEELSPRIYATPTNLKPATPGRFRNIRIKRSRVPTFDRQRHDLTIGSGKRVLSSKIIKHIKSL